LPIFVQEKAPVMKAIWNNTVLAQSTKTELVEGNHYSGAGAMGFLEWARTVTISGRSGESRQT
jgi:hypothetical protein